MKRFTLNQRVRVKMLHFELDGKTGRVVRIRIADDGAWVAMDEPLPSELRKFPEGDGAGREDHIMLYPLECESVKEKP